MVVQSLVFSADDTGVVVAPSPVERCASIRLTSSGVVMFANGADVRLGWEDYHCIESDYDAPPPDGWSIRGWAVTRGAGLRLGLAIHLFVVPDDRVAALVHVTSSRWRRRLAGVPPVGALIPIVVADFVYTASERETLQVLAAVLRDHPTWRTGLDDPGRRMQLAADLSTRLPRRPHEPSMLARDAIDVMTAMRQAGLVYPYGRPLCSGAVVSIDEAVDAVRRRLAENPYRSDRQVDESAIAGIVGRYYLSVEPWPFDSLAS